MDLGISTKMSGREYGAYGSTGFDNGPVVTAPNHVVPQQDHNLVTAGTADIGTVLWMDDKIIKNIFSEKNFIFFIQIILIVFFNSTLK